MGDFKASPMTPETFHASLAVNLQYEAMLAPLSIESLGELVGLSCYAKQCHEGSAFLIALDWRAAYDCENFRWFKARYDRFIYIDRIAIGDAYHRTGLARGFYENLTLFAREKSAHHLCAEVNISPPNPASHAFHRSMDFNPVGDGMSDGKHVQYYVKSLTA